VQVVPQASAEDLDGALEGVGGCGPVLDDPLVVGEPELDLRPGQRQTGRRSRCGPSRWRPSSGTCAAPGVEEELPHLHQGPAGAPVSATLTSLPPSMLSSVAASEAASRVTRENLDTAAMLGRASPRNRGCGC